MRRFKLVLGVAALMVAIMAAAAAPASAQVFTSNNDDGDRNDFCDFFDLDCDFDNDFVRDFDFADGIDQDVEQEAESGDVDQSFTVTGGGDNSNQCVSTQGVANTGNVQNVIDVVDTGDFNGDFDRDDGFFDDGRFDGDGDFEFDELNSSIEVSPESSTTCDSQVNQAASASG